MKKKKLDRRQDKYRVGSIVRVTKDGEITSSWGGGLKKGDLCKVIEVGKATDSFWKHNKVKIYNTKLKNTRWHRDGMWVRKSRGINLVTNGERIMESL